MAPTELLAREVVLLPQSLLFRCASGVVATFLTLQFVACASDPTTSAGATDPQGAIYVNSPTLNALFQTSSASTTFVATDDSYTRYEAPKGFSGYVVRNGDAVELHVDYVVDPTDGDGCGSVPQRIVTCRGSGTLQPTNEK